MNISDESMYAALMREIRAGRRLMEYRQQARERACAQEAQAMRGHKSIPGLGKCLLNIPAHEFFLIREKYGDDAFSDRGFIRDFQRLEPHLAVHKA